VTNSVGKAGTYLFEPIVVGSALYAAGANGTVFKNRCNPTAKRSGTSSLTVILSAGVGSDGTLTAVGGPQGQVYLLGPDGKLQWQASAEGEIITPPLVGNGYCGVRTIRWPAMAGWCVQSRYRRAKNGSIVRVPCRLTCAPRSG